MCEVDAGPLAVGATHHETCVVSLTEADAGDHPVRVLVVARGTGAGQATLDEEIVLLPLVLPGAHVEVYLLEIGLNDTRPAPGDTVVLEVQIYNVGSETLDVATRTDPNAPDCARVLESVTAAEVRSFRMRLPHPCRCDRLSAAVHGVRRGRRVGRSDGGGEHRQPGGPDPTR